MPLEYIEFKTGDVIDCWIVPHGDREPTYLCKITPVEGPQDDLGEFEDIEIPVLASVTLSSETQLKWDEIHSSVDPHITIDIDADMKCSLEGGRRSEGYEIYDCEVSE